MIQETSFAAHRQNQNNGEEYGMSLRDYFAAKSLQGFCADGSMADECSRRGLDVDESRKVYAKNAYAMADAMLEARGKA